jgi:hypothetical protein
MVLHIFNTTNYLTQWQQARNVRAMDQGRQRRDQVDAAVMLLVRRQRRTSSASCADLQSRQLHADTGSAGGDQALVADQPAGETREDRRQGRASWPLRHLPDGGGGGAEGIVPRDFAADRGTTATATTSACVRRRWSCVQERQMGVVCPNASENGQISPRPSSGLPEVTVAVRIAFLPCRKAGKTRLFTPGWGSSGESRSHQIWPASAHCRIFGWADLREDRVVGSCANKGGNIRKSER